MGSQGLTDSSLVSTEAGEKQAEALLPVDIFFRAGCCCLLCASSSASTEAIEKHVEGPLPRRMSASLWVGIASFRCAIPALPMLYH